MKHLIALFVRINGHVRQSQAGTFSGVFHNSRVNGAENFQEQLPVNGWEWPKGTFLQSRLEQKNGKH